jgi:hypothetical protein
MALSTRKQYGTIRIKLDEERALHNGFGAEQFGTFWRLHKQFHRLFPRTVIGLLMNVSSRQVYDWGRDWEALLTVELDNK